MKSVLIITFSNLDRDARVRRQIRFVKKNYRVTLLAPNIGPDSDIAFIPWSKPALTGARKVLLAWLLITRQYHSAHRLLYGEPPDTIRQAGPFDLIIANDVEALPVAFQISPESKVLFDAHEYAPRHFEDRVSWRIFFQPFNVYLCRQYLHRLSAMTTIGKGLAQEYEKNFQVQPVIVTNASTFTEQSASAMVPGKIRLIHHGVAAVSRNLEIHIELMNHLDERFTLDFMLIPTEGSSKTKNYIDHLKALAASHPRIRFVPPADSQKIPTVINQYDMGVFLLPPVNFNYANTLPNKLFDFIQGRLGIAIGPTPEMASVVNQYDIGVVSDDFTPESLAKVMNRLTPEDVRRFKDNSGAAAAELNAGKNEKIFLALIDKTLSHPKA
jgi:hypothetical protein